MRSLRFAVMLLAFGFSGAALAQMPEQSPDPAALRAEMARLHSGKVDDAAMLRIDADIAVLHAAPGITEPHGAAGMVNPHTGGAVVAAAMPAPAAKPKPHATETWNWLSQVADRNDAAKPVPAVAVPTDGRSYVGQETCMVCHPQESTTWAHTLHAKVFGLNPRSDQQAKNCEACHGPGSAHVEEPSDLTRIISFSKKSTNSLAQQNGQCLTCHSGGQRIFWHDSIHDSNQLGCADCHNPMTNFGSRGLTARESINETCFQCHTAQHAEFQRRSHMPLLEGKLSCTDCHNPHGSTTAPLLKADSVNEICFTCHAEKRGPFLFEHAPVRDNCLNCHSPHGSNFESLLTTPRPVLCQQCHSQPNHPGALLTIGNRALGSMPDPRLIATSCSTCHVNIHGSNSPSGGRFER